jgi:hypothetical protein
MGFLPAIEFIEVLEAAIGIEPMNKGFAVLRGLFSHVLVDAGVYGFINVFGIPRLCVFAQIRD